MRSNINHNNQTQAAFKIQRRRKSVAELMNRGDMSETEISNFLNCAKSTVSKDIKYLKHHAQVYVWNLAKQDLAYFYVSTIQDLDKARATAWAICNGCEENKDRIAALKVIVTCNVERFKLLTEGPAVMASRAVAERVDQIEANLANGNGNDRSDNTNG